MRLDGKTVYITGGTGGIGTPLVELLRQAGVVVTAHDLEKEGDLVANLETIAATLAANPPDILINMAGVVPFGYAEKQNYPLVINLNLLAAMRLSQAVLPGMKARKSGQIVNVSSMVALIPLPYLTGYSASKAGLKAFGDALRRELMGSGITVTTIAPRAVRTPANNGPMALLNERTGTAQDSPYSVARRIFNAIERGEREARIGWPESFFAVLNALMPALVDGGLRKNQRIGKAILDKQ